MASMEAVVENLVGEPMILRPEGGPKNHWISFQLEGVKVQSPGAECTQSARPPVIWCSLGEVISGGSYLSQNDLRLHFGFGSHESVDQAEVFWPDGKKESLRHLAADRFYVVREGHGIVSTKLPVHSVNLP